MEAYDSHVSGRLLHDTLLDAIRFFDQCDSKILQRDQAGQIAGLPLPPLPVGGYHRLHPDWPTHKEVELKIRSIAQATAPAGLGRHVDGVLTLAPHGTFLCGYTDLPHGRRQVFTEPVAQVVSDVKGGYRYEALIDGILHPLVDDSGSPSFNGQPLGRAGIADLSDTEPWRGWSELVATDASYYRDQRQAE